MNKIKSIILLLLLPSLLFSDEISDVKLKIAIQLYKDNKNDEAKSILLDIHKNDKSGKSNYYLANVYLNLNKPERAIDHYTQAINKKYDINNSLFNLACAYSLNGEQRETFYLLLLNIRLGDRKTNRVHTDKDLNLFRKSKYFKYFIKYTESEIENGYYLSSKNEFFEYLKDNKNQLSVYKNDSPSPPTYTFDPSGKFFEFSGGGYAGFVIGGYWSISEDNSEVIIQKNGWLVDKYTEEYKKTNSKDKFDKDYRYISYYENPKIEKFQINQIKLIIVKTPETLDEVGFIYDIIIYSQFGDMNFYFD